MKNAILTLAALAALPLPAHAELVTPEDGEFRDGVLYAGDPPAPYTGAYEFVSSSGARQTGTFVDGVRQGRYEVTLPDGKRETGTFVDGVKHGPYEVGAPEAEPGAVERGTYKDGVKQGRYEVTLTVHKISGAGAASRWEAVIRARETGAYKDGVKQGRYEVTWPGNGAREAREVGTYVDGEKHGPAEYYYPSGKFEARRYEKGIRVQ